MSSTQDEQATRDATPEHGPALHDEPEKPPPGVGAMAIVRWAMLALTILAAAGSWWTFARADAGSTTAPTHQCPMHPQIVSNGPGDCPICFMSLEPISADRLAAPPAQAPAPTAAPSPAPAGSGPSVAGKHTCPMHPEVVSDGPGRCPKCKMALVPVTKAGETGPAGEYICPMCPEVVHDGPGRCPKCKMALEPKGGGGGAAGDAPGGIPAGTAPVTVALDRMQSIGVRLSPVEERTVDSSLRVTAVVAAPEQNVAEVHVRTAGFVEAIAVRETGVSVKAGQLLLSIYSPEVYQAQSELLAMRDLPGLADAGATSRTDLALRKLELLGVSKAVSERILASGKPLRAIGVSTPIKGIVTRKNVVLGSFVTPEMALYEITDLSKVYVLADVFQEDVRRVSVGMPGRFSSTSRKEVSAEAKVDLVYPQVNAEARTTRVRMQLDNEKLGLLPGEYGYVEFSAPARKALTVPRDALVDTGRQTYVFVEEGPGRFSPRVVETGGASGEGVEITRGLTAGLRVVSGATFLLDSESRLQASLAAIATTPAGSPCDSQIDRAKYPDKWDRCVQCEKAHAGMGAMLDDCKHTIPQPWR